MILATPILAVPLAAVMLLVRSRWHIVADVWRGAKWWERCVLVLALAPIPGPVDELAGVLVARRVAGRIAPARKRLGRKSPSDGEKGPDAP